MDADAETASSSVAYRIEHHTPQGAATVRHLVDIDLRADTTRISRLFQEVLAGFQARGETGRLVMIEAATGEVVESATIPAAMGSNPSRVVAVLGAIGMKPRRATDVPGILARHGIDPDADAETLIAALEERGWLVTIEATGIGYARRYTAHATRVDENPRPHSFPMVRTSRRTTGPTPRAALTFALAKAIEKEREA